MTTNDSSKEFLATSASALALARDEASVLTDGQRKAIERAIACFEVTRSDVMVSDLRALLATSQAATAAPSEQDRYAEGVNDASAAMAALQKHRTIYQVIDNESSAWNDVDWLTYESTAENDRRTVFTAIPLANPSDKGADHAATAAVAQDERAAFEAWIIDADIGDLAFGRDGECYVDWDTQVAWRGWRGARDATPPPAINAQTELERFDEWFDAEYPLDEEGGRPRYQGTCSLELMVSAWQGRTASSATAPLTSDSVERALDRVLKQSKNPLFRSGAKICAAEILSPTKQCTKAPEGWSCSRAEGHEGPCAASQSTNGEQS